MAQSFYPIDLQGISFPMLSEQQTRTVIGSEVGKSPSEINRPGVAYCHNVMPSQYGYDSVGYLSVIPAFSSLPVGRSFVDTRVIFGDDKSRIDLAWDNEGSVYALLTGATAWIALPATSPATGGPGFTSESVTTGTVNGVTYIFYSTIGAFTYNEGTDSLDSVTLTGISLAVTLGVVASSGYLVAYTDLAIAWSSTLDPTDFVPSMVTGSGGGNVAGTAGAILFIVANTLGLLVYTAANTLAGTYTGNVQFPFKFREIEDSKGGISLDRVAYEANSPEQFVYSKAGLQSITSRIAKTVLPEVTDFLAGRRLEDWDEATKAYIITDLAAGATMLKKIKYVASRYLVISYGVTSFTHALIFDTSLNRMGKLKTTHVDAFEYIGAQTEISKESIAFLSATGVVQVLDFSAATVSTGVLILGKLQATRTRLFTLLGIEVENAVSGDTLSVATQLSLDGKTMAAPVEGTVSITADQLREYKFRATAKSHSIVFTGEFSLVTAQVRYTIAGRR